MAKELQECGVAVFRNEREVDEEMDKLVECFENLRHRQLWDFLDVATSKLERMHPPDGDGAQKTLDEGTQLCTIFLNVIVYFI